MIWVDADACPVKAEVEAVASRVLLVSEGRLAFDGTPEELRQRGDGDLDRAFHRLTETEKVS